MNTPKTPKRAKDAVADAAKRTRPAFLFSPVSDPVAAYIGLVVTDYAHLENRMISVFRVILGIESGEAATLAYLAITSPAVRWKITRGVLERDHAHTETPTVYDDLIDEFEKITKIRNKYVHGLWQMDSGNHAWLTRMQEPLDIISPRKVAKSEFNALLDRMEALRGKVALVTEAEIHNLNRRWRNSRRKGVTKNGVRLD